MYILGRFHIGSTFSNLFISQFYTKFLYLFTQKILREMMHQWVGVAKAKIHIRE